MASIPLMGIFKGMATTLKHLGRPKDTYEYPEVKRGVAERWRGRIALRLDRCIGCSMCAQACPNGSCTMTDFEHNPDANKKGTYPQVEVAKCIYCGFCEEVCPVECIHVTREYELARYQRGALYSPVMLDKTENQIRAEEPEMGDP
ncbi:MAG: NADH-quinone oxidoreductase subunit I [Euryarchaeota archaeon]|nr:NADH-quinone oxidoreductase subunit I [Euryarchaeota archaeon]